MTTKDSPTDSVVAAIDAVVAETTTETCAQCERPLDERSPASFYFCGEDCQQRWHEVRVQPRPAPWIWLEPEYPPLPLPDTPAVRPPTIDRGLQHELAYVHINRQQMPVRFFGLDTSATAAEVGSPMVPEDVRRRWLDELSAAWDVPAGLIDSPLPPSPLRPSPPRPNWHELVRALSPAFQAAAHAIEQLIQQLGPDTQKALGVPAERIAQSDIRQEGAGDTPMQRAIRAKRHRNTGPERRERKDRHRKTRGSGEWFQI